MSSKSVRSDGVRGRFETEGPSWNDRASVGELEAVLDPFGNDRGNRFLHGINTYGAKVALSVAPKSGVLLDFGCGTGRFVRFFGARGYSVIGIEITEAMLTAAREIGVPKKSVLLLSDGITIPVCDQSVDIVWVCGVLKYSLFINEPVYREIANEMYRVLKPGGLVVNTEMYVAAQPETFTRDFEGVGFKTDEVLLLRREGLVEKYALSTLLPAKFMTTTGQLCALLRRRFADPKRVFPGLRDYLFVWSKPTA